VSTEQLTLDGVPGRRILRLYNLYRVIIGLALVLLISSDLPEVLAMSDRIGVMRGGRLVETLSGGAEAPAVMAVALGQTKGAVA